MLSKHQIHLASCPFCGYCLLAASEYCSECGRSRAAIDLRFRRTRLVNRVVVGTLIMAALSAILIETVMLVLVHSGYIHFPWRIVEGLVIAFPCLGISISTLLLMVKIVFRYNIVLVSTCAVVAIVGVGMGGLNFVLLASVAAAA